MHVAEILLDAGPNVVLCPRVDLNLHPTLFCTGETRVGNRQTYQG